MKYFYATLEEFQTEIAIWIRNYFPELRVTKSAENRLILATEISTDVRLVAEKIGSDLLRLELRSYEELHPIHRLPSRQVQEIYKNLSRKIAEAWPEPSQLPHGESDRTSERTTLPIELEINTRTLQSLDSMVDEDKGPDYEVVRQQLEEERQKLEQRRENLWRELDEIFSEETETIQDAEDIQETVEVIGDSNFTIGREEVERGPYQEKDLRATLVHYLVMQHGKTQVIACGLVGDISPRTYRTHRGHERLVSDDEFQIRWGQSLDEAAAKLLGL